MTDAAPEIEERESAEEPAAAPVEASVTATETVAGDAPSAVPGSAVKAIVAPVAAASTTRKRSAFGPAPAVRPSTWTARPLIMPVASLT